jgi:AcrR family transcriptional regulator
MSVTVIVYDLYMSRWDPDARGRMERVALDLFLTDGYDQVTAADIAARAGLSERTFFRHFSDKREVLFGDAAHLQEVVVNALASSELPASARLDAAVAALGSAGSLFDDRAAIAQLRNEVIAADERLQEREHHKLAALTAAMAETMERRGADEIQAAVIAQAAIAVFRVAFARWIVDPKARPFRDSLYEAYGVLRSVVTT